MVIMTPEAKLIPASLRHQIQARTPVITTRIATAASKKKRGARLPPAGEEYDSLARTVGRMHGVRLKHEAMERGFLLSSSGTRSIPRSRLHKNTVFAAAARTCAQASRSVKDNATIQLAMNPNEADPAPHSRRRQRTMKLVLLLAAIAVSAAAVSHP